MSSSTHLNASSVTPEELVDLTRILNTQHAVSLKDRRFSLSVDLVQGHACVYVTLSNPSESFYYPVEAALNVIDTELSVKDGQLFLIDYISFYFDDYFSSGETTYLPIDWGKFTFEGHELQMRGQIMNRQRDRLADELLS